MLPVLCTILYEGAIKMKKDDLNYDMHIIKIVSDEDVEYLRLLEKSKKVLNHKLVKPLILASPIGMTLYIAAELRKRKRVACNYMLLADAITKFDFPDGVPRINNIYVANPKVKNVYYPFNQFHHYIFQHQFAELIRLFQSLGVKDLKISKLSGTEKEFNSETKASYSGGEAGGGFGKEHKYYNEIVYEANYEGHDKPELPANLFWYEDELSLQEIVRSRLKRELKNFNIQIKSEKDWGVNHKLYASLTNYDLSINGKFERKQNYILSITGTFL